ncbi:MAG TPA: asparagine synthase (glutamine-hydrolyzing) [Polyangia bacterium]
MCGIFGSVGEPVGPETIGRVAAVLHHRGPESQGVAQVAGATLLHARLKIIDLSPAGAQPMTNEDGTVWITFNGEIYNFQELRRELEAAGHRFRSHSDTEVIVHGYEEWGDRVVERIDGMFAFGLWDTRKRRLLLARDRTGKKPLFYAEHAGRFLFASEIKGLFAAGVPVEVDDEGLGGMLAFGYSPPPGSLYRGVFQLPPAHRLVKELGRTPVLDNYWTLDFSARRPAPSEAEAKVRIRELLTEAVRKRLVADVPVGAFLSGGLDSTIVVGLMAELSARVRTFSIGFTGDPRFDETEFARLAAKRFGTDHTEFKVTPGDFDLVERLVWHHDGPFGDSSAIPTYVVSKLTRQEVTVALTGDGGDELFAGYLRFWAAANTERIPQIVRRLGGVAGRLLPSGTGSRSFLARARRLLAAARRPLGDRLTAWISIFAFSLEDILRPEHQVGLRGGDVLDRVLAYHRGFFDVTRTASPLAQALSHNFGTYLPQDLLVKTDRTSMAHALEARSPFLDTAFMEYVAGLPDDFKLRGRTTKYILRETFADLMPPQIKTRGKMGFGLPLGTWFRGDLMSYVRDLLTAPNARIAEYLQPQTVARVVNDHISGREDHEHKIWLLITMEIWLRNLSRLSQPWDDSLVVRPAEIVAPAA